MSLPRDLLSLLDPRARVLYARACRIDTDAERALVEGVRWDASPGADEPDMKMGLLLFGPQSDMDPKRRVEWSTNTKGLVMNVPIARTTAGVCRLCQCRFRANYGLVFYLDAQPCHTRCMSRLTSKVFGATLEELYLDKWVGEDGQRWMRISHP